MYKPSLARLFFVLLLISGAHALYALDADRNPGQYTYRLWSRADGLPVVGLNSVLQSRHGHLWVGTEAGLARFDGHRFEVYNKLTNPEMQSPYIGHMAEAADGSLWFATTKGLHHLRGGRMTVYDESKGMPSGLVSRLALDKEGGLWVSTVRGLVRIANGKITPYTKKDGLIADRTGAILVDEDGTVWIGAAGLTRYAQGRFEAFRAKLQHPVVTCLARTKDGRMWVGTMDGLYHFDGKDFHLDPRVPKGNIAALHADANGTLWVSAEEYGLLRLRGSESVSVPVPKLSNGDIRGLAEDGGGSLWLATEQGLGVVHSGPMVTHGAPEGLPNEAVHVVMEDRQHRMWVGTDDGIAVLEGPQRGRVTRIGALPAKVVSAFHEDRHGRMWVGLRGGVGWMEGLKYQPFRDSSGIVNEQVLAITTDADDTLWVATTRGIMAFRKGVRTVYGTKQGLMNPLAHTLVHDGSGHIWAATNDGLFVWNGERFEARHFRSGSMRSVHMEADGTIWVGTAGLGLQRVKNGKTFQIDRIHGLNTDHISNLLDDGRGYFWIGAPEGVLRISRQELHDVADGKRSRIAPVRFTAIDGMREPEINGGWQPSAWRAHDGTLWFSSRAGAVEVHPGQVPSYGAPQAQVETVTVEGKPLGADLPVVAPGAGRVEIRFAAVNLLWPEQMRFRYRMQDVDRGWTEANATRTASYNLLPPGQHTFLVEASDRSGNWSGNPSRITVEQQPHFYQTSWFAGLCVLCGGLLLWLVHRERIRRLQARHALVLHERTRIARELHDSLLQEIFGASLQLDVATDQFFTQPESARKRIVQASDRLREAFRDTRVYIGQLRTNLRECELVEAFRVLARKVCAHCPVEVTVTADGQAVDVPDDVRFELLQMGREMISNAVKHANCSAIDVELRFGSDNLLLSVRDDGKGFAPESPYPKDTDREHWGLVGLRERASTIGGRLNIESAPGKGTCISCELPLLRPNRWALRPLVSS